MWSARTGMDFHCVENFDQINKFSVERLVVIVESALYKLIGTEIRNRFYKR